MGSSHTNNSISYNTKQGYQISYLYWDMKGRNRFPQAPGQAQVNFMLQRCLQQIILTQDQLKQIMQFNNKYKYRFVILHKRKLAQVKKQKQLQNFKRQSIQLHNTPKNGSNKNLQEKNKMEELQNLMKDVQLNQTVIKVALMKIDKLMAQRYAHNQFIKIKGFQRLIAMLEKDIKQNLSGTKTNFSNQIQLLKFIKYFSTRYPKQFYSYIPRIKNYASTIIRAYHPINTHITAYCTSLLTDYLWRIQIQQQGENIIQVLQKYYCQQQNYQSFLSPFIESIQQSDSIIMVYYNLKFINQLIAAIVDDQQKLTLKQNLNIVKYGFILDSIKIKLQQSYYSIENATFISMHQKIFKYVTKSKSKNMNSQSKKDKMNNSLIFEQNMRTSLNMNALQELILKSFLDNQEINQNIFNQKEKYQDQEQGHNDQQMIIAYIGQSDRRRFNKFILDTLTQIQNYSKLQFYLQNINSPNNKESQTLQLLQNQLNIQTFQSYISRIKQSCIKNNCNQLLNSCLKNLQYFQKNQWKHLERFILQELSFQKNITQQIQQLKNILQQKQNTVKRLIKQNNELKIILYNGGAINNMNGRNQIDMNNVSILGYNQKEKINNSFENNNINTSMFKKKYQNQQNNILLLNLPIPPTLNYSNKNQKPMRDKPKLNIQNIKNMEISINYYKGKLNGDNNLNNLLFPPPLLGSVNLSPPPSLGSVNLPPPPPLGSVNLPPPPPLGSVNLPPPPPLGSVNLPPPPPLGSVNLLPPPPLSSINLLPPPPPPLGGLNLPPPPPPLGSLNLPPPLLSGLNLPPPPPLNGINLPPPPPLMSVKLPPAPVLNLPQIPTLSGNLNIPSLNIFLGQVPLIKQKQKRKPKVPLKACNYTTLSYDKIANTIFDQIDDLKIQLNQEQLIQMFAKNQSINKNSQQQNKSKSTIIGPSSQSEIKPKQIIKLLSPDRWRNIQIVLTKLKIPPGEIKKCLIQCSGKYISHSILQSIYKILPNQQQEQNIRNFQGNQEQLGKPQRFMKQIIQVKQYSNRIKAMIFANIKEEFYYELSTKLEQLQKGFKSFLQNNRLKHVLQVCLALGNFLNGTTLRGGAWGFKLQTIQRLQQVKSADNKSNLAFYLIRQVWKKYPYPIFDKDQIQMYQYLSKMPISQINQQIGQLNVYLKSIKKAFESQDKNNSNDNIGVYCEQTMMELIIKLQQYKILNQKLRQIYLQCSKFYCEDGTKLPSDQFGKKMYQCVLFISNTQKMYKIIEDVKAKQNNRKAVKNQMIYNQNNKNNNINPQYNKNKQKKLGESQIISDNNNTKINITNKLQNDIQKDQKMNRNQKNMNINNKVNNFNNMNNNNYNKIGPKVQPVKLPGMSILPPLPPKITKQEKFKQIEKMQQQRQKKALQQVMLKRTSKLQAYRMSKMSQQKKQVDVQIDFLKGIK